jgi:hypothetical protein
MVTSLDIQARAGDPVIFNTINDYGALSKSIVTSVK